MSFPAVIPALVVLGQVTAVLLLTLLFSRVFARRNAALNISVNLWGLAAALACPALFALVAAAGVSWVTLPAPAPPPPAAAAPDLEPVARAPAPGPTAAAAPVVEPPAPSTAKTVEARPEAAAEVPVEPPPPAPSRFRLPDPATIAALIWAAGALFFTLRLLHGWRLQARLRTTLRPADLDHVLAGVRESMGLRSLPPVTVSAHVRTPCSIGLFRPVLILPEGMLPLLTPEALEDILVHECAHVLHRHHWVGLLQRVAAIVYWPHPLVHVVNRDLSRRLEELCDNHVLESREAASYARTLLEVLEKAGPVGPVAAGVGLLPPRWKMSDRIAGLLDERRRIVTRARVSAALGIGTLLAAAGVALAGIRTAELVAVPDPEPTQAAAVDPDGPLPSGALRRFGSTRFRHAPGIQMLAFSPDGKTLVAGGNYGVTGWEVATGKQRLENLNCTGYAAFSPDGKLLAAGGSGNSVLLWDAATGAVVERGDLAKDGLPNRGLGGMRLVTFSADGKQIYSSGQDGTIRILDAADGKELRVAKGPAKTVATAVIGADGKGSVVVSDGNREKLLWDLETGAEILKFPAGTAYRQGVAVSPDGATIAFSGIKPDPAGNHVFEADQWDLVLKKKIRTLDDTTAVAFSRNGATLATGDARKPAIHLREASTGKVLRTIDIGRGSVGSLAFSPDGAVLASASGQAVRLWDTATGRELPAASGHDTPVGSIAFSPDGKLLATSSGRSHLLMSGLSGGSPDPIRLWDAATGRELRTIDGPRARTGMLAFSPDGKRLAGAGGNAVSLWDVATAKPILAHEGQKEVLRTERDGVPFTSVAFSPDGATLAAGARDGTLIFWKAATGEKIRSLDGEAVTSLAYSPDGKLLALGLTDHTVRIRDASGAREIRNIPIPRNNGGSSSSNGMPNPSTIRVSFSPDGRALMIEYAGGFGNRAGLWEVATGKEYLKWDQMRGITPISLTFSPDGTTLASTTPINLWDAASIRRITGFEASLGTQHGLMRRMASRDGLPLAFSPDGKGLAVAADDSTVVLWNVDPASWPVYIRPRAELRTLEQLWEDLASKDATVGHRAVQESVRHGDRAVAFLKERLRPAAADAARIRKLIADLEDERAETRQEATTQLKTMDSAAEPLIREALAAGPTGELKARLAELLETFESPMTDLPESLRARRAVWAAEKIGTPEARTFLSALSQGPAGRLSRDARSAFKRLKT